jgi:elongation factor G
MDRMGASYEHSIESIRKRLGANPIAMQIPIGAESTFKGVIDLLTEQAIYWDDDLGREMRFEAVPAEYKEQFDEARATLVERIAELDDDLTIMFLEGDKISVDELKAALRKAVISNRASPVCGTSLHNKGVQPILDAIVDYLPSPEDIAAVKGTNPDNGQEVTCAPDDDAPMSALVFKIVTDPYVGRLAYLRVYSGKVTQGVMVHNPIKGKKERVGRLLHPGVERYVYRRYHLRCALPRCS